MEGSIQKAQPQPLSSTLLTAVDGMNSTLQRSLQVPLTHCETNYLVQRDVPQKVLLHQGKPGPSESSCNPNGLTATLAISPGTEPIHEGNHLEIFFFCALPCGACIRTRANTTRKCFEFFFQNLYSHLLKYVFAPSPPLSVWIQWLYSHTPDANTYLFFFFWGGGLE